jgi:hypothetical protein
MNAPDHGLREGARVRASDAERERIAKLLEAAAADGRLTPDEAGERLAAASAATYREELARLVADLPVPLDPESAVQSRRWRGAWWPWRAIRFAFVVMLVIGLWGFWGMRLLLWPLGFAAFAFFLGPWRRRRWQRWQRAAPLRGWYPF